MNREFLKSAGVADEAIDKIMAEWGKAVQSEKDKSAAVQAEAEKLNAELETYKAKVTDLEKAAGDHEGVLKELDDLKRPMVGMDKTLFERSTTGMMKLPRTGLFTPVNPGGLGEGGKLWEVYDPAIRDSAYYNRLEQLYALLERQVGTSRGILTQPESRGATATEIKAALYDTYSLLVLFRTEIERGMDALLYAFEVLANAWNLAPFGECELSFDWSYSMIESSQETFQQLVTAQQSGAVEAAEVRQYIMPDETLEEAQARVAEIAEAKKSSSAVLLDEAMDEEAQQNGF